MYRVLLADDEVIIRENVSRHVPWPEHGFELVTSCQNGQEAVDYISSNPVDLIITDICMPIMDGMELCKFVHENYPHIKIILLSGYDEFEYAKKAIRYDVVEYVLKPVTSKEMCELLDRVHTLLDKERSHSEMEVSYRDNYQQLLSNTLADFIIGNKSLDDSTAELERLGLPVWTQSFRVAVLELNMYTAELITDRQTQVESSLTSFVVYNVANELVMQENAGVVCQDNNYHTIILFHNDDNTDSATNNHELCQRIMYQLKEMLHLKVTIGLGRTVTSAEQIPLSYSEAKQALLYRYVKGDNRVIEYSSINSPDDVYIDKQCTAPLMEAVKNTDANALNHALFLIRHELQTHNYKKDKASFLLSWCIEALFEKLQKYGQGDGVRKESALSSILKAETLDTAIDVVQQYSEACIQALLDNRSNGSRNYVRNAIEYIEGNYNDSELSLKSICAYLNISVSRFSSLFKAQQGETFMETLTRIRMEHAKELLLHTDLKNYEIAERVGFSDPHYFGIAFKKDTGKTPTEFRNTNSQD